MSAPAYIRTLDRTLKRANISRVQIREALLESQARDVLTSWLDAPKPKLRSVSRGHGADFVVEHERTRLVVECKAVASSAALTTAIAQVKAYAEDVHPTAVPVVAVPFMGEVGKRLCERADVSWFDVSGNAHIVAPGLRILIEGKPNKFVRRGRPSTAFAPKSARIARHLLIDPRRSFRQQELARETGLDDGFTSRIVRRLEGDELLVRAKDGTISVRNPDLLLDDWAAAYRFDKHDILRGHISARSSEELVGTTTKTFARAKVEHAVTGLAAARLLTEFSAFRLVTIFVARRPGASTLKELGFREEPKGANVWLVVPDDEGVFDGVGEVNGINVVHPVQAFVDLAAQPERAKDAAAELRAQRLRWTA